MNARLMSLALLSPLALFGCGAAFELALPARFVSLDEDEQEAQGYAMRATTADGVVVAVREIDNDPEGDLVFWQEAITLELRDRRGYALVDDAELRAASGEAGRLLRFGHDEEGEAYRYWMAIFVTDDRIFLVEAGGADEVFSPVEGDVEAAMRGFRIP
jgi:hypothetical protein